jgi:hypothetical protein
VGTGRWHYIFKDNSITALPCGDAMTKHIREACQHLSKLCIEKEEQWILQSMETVTLIRLQDLVEGELKRRALL